MSERSSRVKKFAGLIVILLLLPATFLFFFSSLDHQFDTLPYYGDQLIVSAFENGIEVHDTLNYRIPEFELTGADGNAFSSKELEDKVYLAAFFPSNHEFISKITSRLLMVNFKYRNEPDIAIMCITLDPEFDTPEVLDHYLEEIEIDRDKFHFLTGNKNTIYDLVENGFLVNDIKNTATIWLVDQNGHLRGKYNGNKEKEMQRAMEDIALLKKEIDLEKYRSK